MMTFILRKSSTVRALVEEFQTVSTETSLVILPIQLNLEMSKVLRVRPMAWRMGRVFNRAAMMVPSWGATP